MRGMCAGCGCPIERRRRWCRPCWVRVLIARLDEVDDVVVWRLTHGDRLDSTPGEKRAAVAELTRRGMSARAIAERIGIAERSVVRARARADA